MDVTVSNFAVQALTGYRPVVWVGGILAAMIAVCVLFLFEPTQVAFYPRCLLHEWTGLSCPGCGGFRATHQLLHGNLERAFRLNPLFIGMLPLFGWMLAREVVRRCTGKVLPSPFQNNIFGWTLAGIVILFGVTRNLPFPVFAWMKP